MGGMRPMNLIEWQRSVSRACSIADKQLGVNKPVEEIGFVALQRHDW